MLQAAQTTSAQKLAQVVRTARKSRGLSQVDVKKALGISQAQISKIENGSAVFDAVEWMHFCDITGIPMDSIRKGYIDRGHRVRVMKDRDDGLFKVPDRYRFNRGSSCRIISVYNQFLANALGQAKLDQWFHYLKIDPDFFFDFDHVLNLQIINDSIQMLLDQGLIRRE